MVHLIFFFFVSFAFCCEFCLCVAGMPLAQAISILQKHCRIIKNVQVLYSEQVRWFVFWAKSAVFLWGFCVATLFPITLQTIIFNVSLLHVLHAGIVVYISQLQYVSIYVIVMHYIACPLETANKISVLFKTLSFIYVRSLIQTNTSF